LGRRFTENAAHLLASARQKKTAAMLPFFLFERD
jgi:hypothetical protein